MLILKEILESKKNKNCVSSVESCSSCCKISVGQEKRIEDLEMNHDINPDHKVGCPNILLVQNYNIASIASDHYLLAREINN